MNFGENSRAAVDENRIGFGRDLVALTDERNGDHLAQRGQVPAKHDDPIGEIHRLVHIVGDEQHRDTEFGAEPQELVFQIGSGLASTDANGSSISSTCGL